MRKHLAKQNAFAILVLLMLVVSGCSPSVPPGIPATGTVTAAGRPLSGAVITLEPIGSTKGPSATAPIFAGTFEFKPDAGLLGGTYLARVAMLPAEIRSSLPAEQAASLPPADAVIDPRFDLHSELTCVLDPDRKNSFDFAVDFL